MNDTQLDPALEEFGNFNDVSCPDRESIPTPAPKVDPAKATPINERAKDWQKQADALVEEGLLGIGSTIAGVSLQPFTTARGSILRRANNEFVQGISMADIPDPFLSVGKFLVLMSVDLKTARKLVSSPDSQEALEDAAYDLLETIPLYSIGDVVRDANSYVAREMSNQVHGSPADDDASKDTSPKN